jgi:hypothetical protein
VSTRSVIARPTPEGGFHGTYCHNDGYPAHQGRILFDAVTGPFTGDPDAACYYLIDQHPAATATATVTSHPARRSPSRPPATPSSTTPTCWTPSGCGRSPTASAGGSRWPSRPGPNGPTGTPSTSTPSTSAGGGSTTARSIAGARHGPRERPRLPPAIGRSGRLVFTASPSWSAWVRIGARKLAGWSRPGMARCAPVQRAAGRRRHGERSGTDRVSWRRLAMASRSRLVAHIAAASGPWSRWAAPTRSRPGRPLPSGPAGNRWQAVTSRLLTPHGPPP